MSRLFGWSYPPGCSGPPEGPEPMPESEHVAEIFERMRDSEGTIGLGGTTADEGQDAIVEYVDNLARQLAEAKDLLRATLSSLSERGPEPPCTCKVPAEYAYCEVHDGDWHNPTLKEEINSFLARKEDVS